MAVHGLRAVAVDADALGLSGMEVTDKDVSEQVGVLRHEIGGVGREGDMAAVRREDGGYAMTVGGRAASRRIDKIRCARRAVVNQNPIGLTLIPGHQVCGVRVEGDEASVGADVGASTMAIDRLDVFSHAHVGRARISHCARKRPKGHKPGNAIPHWLTHFAFCISVAYLILNSVRMPLSQWAVLSGSVRQQTIAYWPGSSPVSTTSIVLPGSKYHAPRATECSGPEGIILKSTNSCSVLPALTRFNTMSRATRLLSNSNAYSVIFTSTTGKPSGRSGSSLSLAIL